MEELIILGKTELTKEEFKPIINSFVKPNGGLWASTYTPNSDFVSSWHKWCNEEMPHWISNNSILLKLYDNVKILTIDCYEDLEGLSFIGERFMQHLDFEKLSKQYDVIHLTNKGECETRFSHPLNLYGWDVESWLIMNYDCIKSWEYKKLDIIKEEK